MWWQCVCWCGVVVVWCLETMRVVVLFLFVVCFFFFFFPAQTERMFQTGLTRKCAAARALFIRHCVPKLCPAKNLKCCFRGKGFHRKQNTHTQNWHRRRQEIERREIQAKTAAVFLLLLLVLVFFFFFFFLFAVFLASSCSSCSSLFFPVCVCAFL